MSQIFEVEAIYGVPRNTTEPSYVSPISTDREQIVVARTQVEVIQGTLHRHVKAPNVIVESEVNVGSKVDFHTPPFTTMVLKYSVPSKLRGYLNPIIADSEIAQVVGSHTKAIFGDTFVRQRLFRKVSSWLKIEASASSVGGREPWTVMYLTYRPPIVILNVDSTFMVQKIVAEAELILASQGGYVNAITTEVEPWFRKNYNREAESYVDVVADLEREVLTHQYTESHTETIHASAELALDSHTYVSAITASVQVGSDVNKTREAFVFSLVAENVREKAEATRTTNVAIGKITAEASLIIESEDSYVDSIQITVEKVTEAERQVTSSVEKIESTLHHRRRYGRINETDVGKIETQAEWFIERVAYLSRLTAFAQGRQPRAGRQPTSYITSDASVRVDIYADGVEGKRIVTRTPIVNPIYAEAYPEAEVSSNVGAITAELEIEIHANKELEETLESYVGRIHTDVTRFIRIRDSIGPRERTICELLYERLPAIYRTKDAELGFPLRRFLTILCQGGFEPLKEDIDRFTDLFDIDRVPAEYLDLLAQKVGFEFPPGNLTTTEKRKFVKLAPHLYARKGTKSGLAYFFSELTGYRVTIVEDYTNVFVTNKSPVGHYYDPNSPGVDINHRIFHPSIRRQSVTLWLGYRSPIPNIEEKRAQLQWIAERYVPAGVQVTLRLYKIEEEP